VHDDAPVTHALLVVGPGNVARAYTGGDCLYRNIRVLNIADCPNGVTKILLAIVVGHLDKLRTLHVLDVLAHLLLPGIHALKHFLGLLLEIHWVAHLMLHVIVQLVIEQLVVHVIYRICIVLTHLLLRLLLDGVLVLGLDLVLVLHGLIQVHLLTVHILLVPLVWDLLQICHDVRRILVLVSWHLGVRILVAQSYSDVLTQVLVRGHMIVLKIQS
jgi:hypothetical protein